MISLYFRSADWESSYRAVENCAGKLLSKGEGANSVIKLGALTLSGQSGGKCARRLTLQRT